MTILAAVLAAMLATAGIVVLVAWGSGAFPRRERSVSPALGTWRRGVPRGDLVRLGIGLAAGLALAVYTGLALLFIVVPLAVWGLPKLLGEPPGAEALQLQALDRWVRTMMATMSTGKSITDALRASARQAPPLLQVNLNLLVRRLDDRWTPGQALRAMADELGSADADAILASLVLAVDRGGTGAVATLQALADSIQDRLRALREIESERAKPRIVVRQVTIITLAVIGLALLIGREYFAPYGTPLGQVLLAAILGLYVLSLVAMRRLTVARRRERILRARA